MPDPHVSRRPARRCLDCPRLTRAGSRCPDCTRARKRRRNADAPTAHQLVTSHLAQRGSTCPGWDRPAHDVDADQLTADHLVAFADGGTLHDGAQVLCRSCNSRKGRG